MIARHRLLFNKFANSFKLNRNFHDTRHLLYTIPTNKNQNIVSTVENVQTINNVKVTPNYKKLDATFENSEIAYKNSSNSELNRALFVFYRFSVKFIVDNQLKVCIFHYSILDF